MFFRFTYDRFIFDALLIVATPVIVINAVQVPLADKLVTVCVPPMDIPGVGRMAAIKDPQGAAFAIIKLETPPA